MYCDRKWNIFHFSLCTASCSSYNTLLQRIASKSQNWVKRPNVAHERGPQTKKTKIKNRWKRIHLCGFPISRKFIAFFPLFRIIEHVGRWFVAISVEIASAKAKKALKIRQLNGIDENGRKNNFQWKSFHLV